MKSPLFIPFNVRNNIINENNTKGKDIEDFKTKEKYSILTSHMKEKEITDGINHRIGRAYFSKAKANFTISNSADDFKKGQVETRYGYINRIMGEQHG